MRKRRQNTFKADKNDKLVIDIKNNLVTRLGDLMLKLLNSAPDKIFTMADNAENNEDQNRYFDLMNKVRSLKSDIADDYMSEIKHYLVPHHEFKAAQTLKKKNDDDELSLIDQDEMDGMVLVKNIGGRAEARYQEQLSHLEARLEHLALKSWGTFSHKALAPTHFCQAFDDSLGKHFNNADKKILFTMFETEVTNKLESVYDSINNRLIDADILPQIKLNAASTPQKRRQSDHKKNQAQQPETNNELADDVQAGGSPEGAYQGSTNPSSTNLGSSQMNGSPQGAHPNPVSHGNYAMTAAPGGNYHASNQINYGQSAPGQSSSGQPQQGAIPTGQAPSGQAGSNGAPGQSGMSGGMVGGNNNTSGNNPGTNASGEQNINNKDFQHHSAGMPAQQISNALSNMFGVPVNQETFNEQSHQNGGAFFPASTNQAFGHEEIIQALSGLQALPQFFQPEQTRFDAEAIKQAVITELSAKTGGVVTKRINQIAEKTIDFIELIFDAIIDDESISDTIKTLLLRLQIPVIKASMSDQEFFIYDDHPARVLLDSIAEVGIGVTNHKDEMYIHLDKIISTLLSDNAITSTTFETALNSLNKIIAQQEEIARKKEEEAQQQTLRSHARKTVLKALRAVTTGKTLPEVVHPLVLKRWPTLMFNHYLEFGKENDEWVNLIETLRDIVESIQPLKSAEDLAILQADKEDIIEITRDYLSAATKSKKDTKNVIQGLTQTYERHINEADFSSEEIEDAEKVVTAMENEPIDEEPNEPVVLEEPKPNLPTSAIPGTWFQLYMGEDQIVRRCKLSVVILEDSNMMFVNHKGELIVEKSFIDFEMEMAESKTTVIMGHSVFDHALKSVVTQLPSK